MIKHIVGFIIFTFIIGTSALVAALLNPIQQSVRSVRVSRNYDHYSSRRRCKKKRRPKRPKVVLNRLEYLDHAQAVYDAETNVLTTSNIVQSFDSANAEGESFLVYHIYAKNRAGVKHLTSVRVKESLQHSSKMAWHDISEQLVANDSLYLIPEFQNSVYPSSAPTFSRSLAVPVLIRNKN